MSDTTPIPAARSRDNAAHRLYTHLVPLSTPCPRCGRTSALTNTTRRTSLGTMISLDQVTPSPPTTARPDPEPVDEDRYPIARVPVDRWGGRLRAAAEQRARSSHDARGICPAVPRKVG